MLANTVIRVKKGVKLNKPILIVGLPGIGGVGKLVAEHLKREFHAKRFATLYSPHFPHHVAMTKSGRIRLAGNRFYLIKRKPQDIVILTGDTQAISPEGQYEVNSKIVDFFKERLGGNLIYTIGGYNIGESLLNERPKVFGNATSRRMIESLKNTDVIFGKSKGLIWGSAGLIIAFAKLRKMDAVCIMGETSLLEVDAGSAKAVIVQLSKILGLNVKTGDLDKIITKTAKALAELERQGGALQGQQQFHIGGGEEAPGAPSSHRPSYIR